MAKVRAGDRAITVPESLLQRASPRIRSAAFAGATADTVLDVQLAERLELPTPLASPHAPWGDVELQGERLLAHIPDDVYAAEAVLRVAWQIVCHRAGGVLMHGCAFHWAGKGVVAIGASGDGKSTLSRLSRGHPAHAQLLSDEIVWLDPQRTCYGTPFRSDEDNAGSPGPARIEALLLLAKGQNERFDVVPSTEALPLLLAQLYMPTVAIVPRGELVRRVMLLTEAMPVHRLTFRKHADVGVFLKRAVGA